ncbi:hypothetical protein IKW75_02705 [Candidatus Saccharibacteria bacterium]|nr:hypothetical protein [Candidatus Saccharibacteria bacterium]
MTKIAFPEWQNEVVAQAIDEVKSEFTPAEFESVSCENLEAALVAVREGIADAMIAGIDYTSRDIILATRDIVGASGSTFSASFLFEKNGQKIVVGDCAACKNPTEDQLFEIVLQTTETARRLLDEEPRVALLSFSTLGSGGKDPSIERAQNVVSKLHSEYPEMVVDGEMQLDAAVNPAVAAKKAPDSPVAGRANVLIAPDLNSGNILYKSLEQFGGFTAAGPLLQGFKAPVSDLSRGSTKDDVKLVIKTMLKLVGTK